MPNSMNSIITLAKYHEMNRCTFQKSIFQTVPGKYCLRQLASGMMDMDYRRHIANGVDQLWGDDICPDEK